MPTSLLDKSSNFTDSLIKEFTFVEAPPEYERALAHIVLGTHILEDADEDFLKTAYAIETSYDVVQQQRIAYEFLEQHLDYPRQFNYTDLVRELPRIKDWRPESCRYAYMLQYSIPLIETHRVANRRPYNWIQRLLVFTNTFIVESTVVGHKWDKYTFNFRTQGKNGYVDHTVLSWGAGEDLPDFYFWDKTEDKFYASIDLKCNFRSENIDQVVEHYRSKKSRHGARYILAYMHNQGTYYMIDYDNNGSYVEVPDLPLPTNLYDIYNF